MRVKKTMLQFLDEIGFYYAEHTTRAGRPCINVTLVTKENLEHFREFNDSVQEGDVVSTLDSQYGDVKNDEVYWGTVRDAIEKLAKEPFNLYRYRSAMTILEMAGVDELIKPDKDGNEDEEDDSGWLQLDEFLKLMRNHKKGVEDGKV